MGAVMSDRLSCGAAMHPHKRSSRCANVASRLVIVVLYPHAQFLKLGHGPGMGVAGRVGENANLTPDLAQFPQTLRGTGNCRLADIQHTVGVKDKGIGMGRNIVQRCDLRCAGRRAGRRQAMAHSLVAVENGCGSIHRLGWSLGLVKLRVPQRWSDLQLGENLQRK